MSIVAFIANEKLALSAEEVDAVTIVVNDLFLGLRKAPIKDLDTHVARMGTAIKRMVRNITLSIAPKSASFIVHCQDTTFDKLYLGTDWFDGAGDALTEKIVDTLLKIKNQR